MTKVNKDKLGNGGQKKIPRASVNPKSVRIRTDEGVKVVKVPKDVPLGKAEAFQEYIQFKWDYEHMDRTFSASNGKVYPLPAMNKKIVSKVLSGSDEVQAFLNKDSEVRKATGKLMSLKRKVYGDMHKGDSISLFDEYQAEVLDLLGRGYSATEVHKELVSRGVNLPYPMLVDFHVKNRAKITELRNAFNSEIQDVSLSSKRSRLEKLNQLYHEINDDFEKVSTPMLRSTLSKELRGIIEQAKKEVEGENLKLTVEGNIDVNASLTAMMDSNRVLYGLTVNQIVIARVAARLRLSSQYLIDRLATSYYAKFNGYRKNDDLATKPIYPTSIQYDILSDEMQAKNKAYEELQSSYEIKEAEVVDEQVQEEEREEIKKRLREMLKI